jgi:hypothetical protein
MVYQMISKIQNSGFELYYIVYSCTFRLVRNMLLGLRAAATFLTHIQFWTGDLEIHDYDSITSYVNIFPWLALQYQGHLFGVFLRSTIMYSRATNKRKTLSPVHSLF